MVQRPDDEADPRDFDARWAEIVAELGEPEESVFPDVPVPPEPGPPEPGPPARDAGHVLSGRDWDGTDQIDAAEDAVDDQEHFVPPDPGPVMSADPLRVLTWAVAVGVPVLYFVLLVAWRNAPGWLAPVAGVLLLAAVGVLVWRMPHHRDHDSDSGAVV